MVESGYEVLAVYISAKGGKYLVQGTKILDLGCDEYLETEKLSIKFLALIKKRAYFKLRHAIKEFHPDVLHAGWVSSCGFLAALSGFHPLLLMPWGSDILIGPRKNLFYRKIVQFTIKRADMITCDAETVKKEIIQLADYPQEKIVVFPWGIDLSLFKPDISLRVNLRKRLGIEGKKVIIMNRSFKTLYGIEYFLKALPKVRLKVPNVHVLLIGSGPLETELRKLVEELKIESVVKFMGGVNNEEMPSYLNASDLYVSSSLSDGTSLSLLEAMACALPVVVTDVPAILEWVENGVNGLVVPRRSIDELAEAIIYLLQREDVRKEMGEKNIAIAKERADWDKNFKKLEDIYKTLVYGGTK
jgi:glycosyltransferase involved in cell wall biosynthesis